MILNENKPNNCIGRYIDLLYSKGRKPPKYFGNRCESHI